MTIRRKGLLGALVLLVGVLALFAGSFFVWPGADFDAVDFCEEYKDWKAADERYIDKSLSIRGKVRSIHHGGGMIAPHGWTTVTIGEESGGVVCLFPTEAVYQTEWLAEGQVVVIHGVCRGSFGWPILSKCRVVGMDLPQSISNWAK